MDHILVVFQEQVFAKLPPDIRAITGQADIAETWIADGRADIVLDVIRLEEDLQREGIQIKRRFGSLNSLSDPGGQVQFRVCFQNPWASNSVGTTSVSRYRGEGAGSTTPVPLRADSTRPAVVRSGSCCSKTAPRW